MSFTPLHGRKILSSELPINTPKHILTHPYVQKIPAMTQHLFSVQCQRCGCSHLKSQVRINQSKQPIYYCPSCIMFQRIQSNHYLYYWPLPQKNSPRSVDVCWQGTLTKQQAPIAQALTEHVQRYQNYLIHAVTGAGKTEMLFPMLAQALKQGKHIALTSPRVDVCLELYPRIQRVFPKEDIGLWYGGQTKPYHFTHLVLCTTHQLLRFYRSFDVLIIDEADAFPLKGHPYLHRAIQQSLKQKHSIIYLTATPDLALKKQVQKKELDAGVLCARYHKHPLPVPKCIQDPHWQMYLSKQKLSKPLFRLLKQQIARHKPTLIFYPNIRQMKKMNHLLRKMFPKLKITCVYAQDPKREKKIMQMRKKPYDFLLTTTILERGVTFKAIDVIIIGADHHVFQSAALIQISGRAGRDQSDPFGRVFWLYQNYSDEMKHAYQEIIYLNELAKQKGWLQ